MLDEKEFRQLFQKAQAGDENTREYILRNNLNLVRSIVRRFSIRGYEWDDLFQIGCIGLIKAIERFDVGFGVSFSTYAVPMIMGEIRRFLRDDGPIKISRSLKELAFRIHRVEEELYRTLGREPSIGELAAELKVNVSDIVTALEAAQTPTSIYSHASYETGDTVVLIDQRKYCEDTETKTFEKIVLRELISRLPELEKKVIKLRFFEDKTQSEIAAIVGLSQVQISRIEKNALRQIRDYIGAS